MIDPLKKYENEIKSIAAFAKRIQFDLENGDVLELVRLWLDDGAKFMSFVEDNKKEVFQTLRFILERR